VRGSVSEESIRYYLKAIELVLLALHYFISNLISIFPMPIGIALSSMKALIEKLSPSGKT